MVRKVNAREAKKLTLEWGWCWTADGSKTFYAVDDDTKSVLEFDTVAERDRFVEDNNG